MEVLSGNGYVETSVMPRLLRRHAPVAAADAFIATRCGPCANGGVLGASPVQGLDSAAILQRALPY